LRSVAPYELDASSEQFRVPGGIGMSIWLIIVVVLALFTVVNFAVKARRGSFLITPIWWRGKSGKDTSGNADGP
jgi:hypothetical protein